MPDSFWGGLCDLQVTEGKGQFLDVLSEGVVWRPF